MSKTEQPRFKTITDLRKALENREIEPENVYLIFPHGETPIIYWIGIGSDPILLFRFPFHSMSGEISELLNIHIASD